ncbi:MAG: glycosyltransferase [Gemmatimonadaceae bacterium]
MKVFLAGTSFAPSYGGPAVSVARLASALSVAGVEVGLWSPDGSAAEANAPGVTLLDGGLDDALETFRPPHIIHDNGIWLPHNHEIAKLAHRRGIPRVVSPRGMLEPWAMRHKGLKKHVAWALYQRRDMRLAACHHAATEVEAKTIEAFELGARIVVIPNGVDLPPKPVARVTSPEGPNTALFLGRIYPVKGLPMLIEAWSSVRPAGWVLNIAGPDEGGHRAEVEAQVSAAGLSDVVSFSGPADDERKSELFSRAQLFVLPTHSESFGMAIAEALAHGVPVLTTTGAPWPDLDETYGWRVEPTVEGLISGLSRATAAPLELLAHMGRAGREIVARDFPWKRIAAKMKVLYRELLTA